MRSSVESELSQTSSLCGVQQLYITAVTLKSKNILTCPSEFSVMPQGASANSLGSSEVTDVC